MGLRSVEKLVFETYTRSNPKMVERLPHKKTGKVYSSSYFQTFCLPCFKELFELFYPYGPKVVPDPVYSSLKGKRLGY